MEIEIIPMLGSFIVRLIVGVILTRPQIIK
jgi:hypothetical protein